MTIASPGIAFVSSTSVIAFAESDQRSNKRILDKVVTNNIDRVIIPYLVNNHWLLMFLRLDHQNRSWSAQLFDSVGNDTAEIHSAHNFIARLTESRRLINSSIFYRWSALEVTKIKVPDSLKQTNVLTAASTC